MESEGKPPSKFASSTVTSVCDQGFSGGRRAGAVAGAAAAAKGGADKPAGEDGALNTTTACNAWMHACSKGKTPEDALKVLAEMKQKGPKPDIVSYTAVIRACEKSRMP